MLKSSDREREKIESHLKGVDSAATSRTCYHSRSGDGVIGFDGCGAIDFTRSDLKVNLVESGPRLADRHEATLSLKGAQRDIFTRRAVREFDFFYDYEFNTLLVSPSVFMDFEATILPSTFGMEPVTVHFGSRQRPYFFGNLKHANVLKTCNWEQSEFRLVYTSDFDINQTRIERNEVTLDHEVKYQRRGQRFSDMADYYKKKPSLYRHIAERLAFDFPPADIINLGIGDTLICVPLFEALWTRKRPKSRVLGFTGSLPLVTVEFGRC